MTTLDLSQLTPAQTRYVLEPVSIELAAVAEELRMFANAEFSNSFELLCHQVKTRAVLYVERYVQYDSPNTDKIVPLCCILVDNEVSLNIHEDICTLNIESLHSGLKTIESYPWAKSVLCRAFELGCISPLPMIRSICLLEEFAK